MENFEPLGCNPFRDTNTVPLNACTNDLPLVSELSIPRNPSALNPTKAEGPDGIPGWLLKENADVLAVQSETSSTAPTVSAVFRHPGRKRISFPKQRPSNDVNKHLSPISLTPILFRVAEDYVVSEYVKLAVLQKIDYQQFGNVPQSYTTYALISMTQNWYFNTDVNGTTTRVVLFDFCNAFNLIDHNILVRKLSTYYIPKQIMCWIVDFLMNLKLGVKLAQDYYSELLSIPACMPQGTKLGPLALFDYD